jgi:hypothetical protein
VTTRLDALAQQLAHEAQSATRQQEVAAIDAPGKDGVRESLRADGASGHRDVLHDAR